MKKVIVILMFCFYPFIVPVNADTLNKMSQQSLILRADFTDKYRINIKVATIDWCPQICLKDETPSYTVGIVNEIFKGSEYKVQVDHFPWFRAIKYVSEELYDALLSPAKKEALTYIILSNLLAFNRCVFLQVKKINGATLALIL